MHVKDLQKGDTVIYTNAHGLYCGVNNMTPYGEYVLQETPVQEEWPVRNGAPFYPELKLSIQNDKGQPVQLKASRFQAKEQPAPLPQ